MILNSMEFKNNYNATIKEAKRDKHVPDDFYSTTNNTTLVYYNNNWIEVKNQRMDALIVIDKTGASCKKLRDIKKGDKVVCGDSGIRIVNENENAYEKKEFNFMDNKFSSERRNDMQIKKLAYDLVYNGKKLTVVAGPVIVHTGGDQYLAELIRHNYVSSLLTGNALAVHDIEKSLYQTSLGVCSKTGLLTEKGYRNHMRAINQIYKYGSIEKAVEANCLKSGIMYECIKKGIPFILAGSLRDDGPLPDTITDMIEAQQAYSDILKDAEIVLVLSTMLHGIAAGNMLAAKCKMICVDINSAVVTKLSDRGSSQATGIVTDVGLFVNLLVNEIRTLERKKFIGLTGTSSTTTI
ncbi:ornithine cyclodeaminase [Paratissierella segnis]|jgi:lysine-ketoglutarate reductase/saccharopine dehydrogenase-like protein (TIGR00300 family)|uniref:TIGR00300 family protein n=1 Tax=Paratissierella segnis TaxID=2763679 RepID=A0A926IJB7_9FIRM|nr:TIGR00300 family protein [Paratissierella segnis]MBC8587070.1 TIGR00300 family protein [Paratissierella segnis]